MPSIHSMLTRKSRASSFGESKREVLVSYNLPSVACTSPVTSRFFLPMAWFNPLIKWCYISRKTSCIPPRLIDFGNYSHPTSAFLNQDAKDERQWSFSISFFPISGIEFDHSTGNGIGRLAFFNGKWTGTGPYVGDRVCKCFCRLFYS